MTVRHYECNECGDAFESCCMGENNYLLRLKKPGVDGYKPSKDERCPGCGSIYISYVRGDDDAVNEQ